MNRALSFFLLISCAVAQQRLDFDWSKLAAKAVEKVDVTLEGPLLEMAAKFLSSEGDEANIKELVQGLKGIYVRSFTFDKEGQYSDADLSAIRSQLRSPDWSQIVDVQEKHESAGIYLKTNAKTVEGFVVLAAQPKELTVVQIIGSI